MKRSDLEPAELPTSRRPGRPARIDRRRIVDAAIAVSTESGPAEVTMSAVAKRLGVAMPGLYHHVSSLDELLSSVAEELLGRLVLPDVRLRWDRWLVTFSYDLRVLLQTQPLLTRLPYLAVHPPFDATALERALRVLTRAGFAPDYALVMFSQHVRVVVDLVHAEHAREHERAAGRSPIAYLRQIATADRRADTPILDAVLARFGEVPDDRRGYDDVLFEWQLHLEIAGWAAALAGDLPTTVLGPPRPLDPEELP